MLPNESDRNAARSALSRRAWLPSPGNVVLAAVVIGVMAVIGQRAGAFEAHAPQAASTSVIAYQGRLADSNGAPLDGSYAMTFKLYTVASGGSPLWTETRSGGSSVAVTDGLFNVLLGSLTPLPSAIAANNGSLWLGITVGGDAEMTPRVQLGSAPYALALSPGAVSQVEQANSPPSISMTSTTWTTVPGLQITFTASTTETVLITFNSADVFIQQSSASGGFRLVTDGSQEAVGFLGGSSYAANTYVPFHLVSTATLAPGVHTIWVEWWVPNGSFALTIGAGEGRLIVERQRR